MYESYQCDKVVGVEHSRSNHSKGHQGLPSSGPNGIINDSYEAKVHGTFMSILWNEFVDVDRGKPVADKAIMFL